VTDWDWQKGRDIDVGRGTRASSLAGCGKRIEMHGGEAGEAKAAVEIFCMQVWRGGIGSTHVDSFRASVTHTTR
jgi:hypothetical protein